MMFPQIMNFGGDRGDAPYEAELRRLKKEAYRLGLENQIREKRLNQAKAMRERETHPLAPSPRNYPAHEHDSYDRMPRRGMGEAELMSPSRPHQPEEYSGRPLSGRQMAREHASLLPPSPRRSPRGGAPTEQELDQALGVNRAGLERAISYDNWGPSSRQALHASPPLRPPQSMHRQEAALPGYSYTPHPESPQAHSLAPPLSMQGLGGSSPGSKGYIYSHDADVTRCVAFSGSVI